MKPLSLALYSLLLFSSFTPADQTLDTFGRISAVTDLQISPDGSHIGFMRDIDGSYFLVVQNLYDGKKKPVAVDLGDATLRGFTWVSSDRILFHASQPYYSPGDYETFTMQRTGLLNTTNNKVIWPFRGRKFNSNISRPELVHKLPNDPEHVLMSYYYNSLGTGKQINALYKVRIADGDREKYFSEAYSTDWLFNEAGDILAFSQFDAAADKYLIKIMSATEQEFNHLMIKKDGESVYFEPRIIAYQHKLHIIHFYERSEDGLWVINTAKVKDDHVVDVKRLSQKGKYDIDRKVDGYHDSKLVGYTIIKDFSEFTYFERDLAQVQADLVATFPDAAVEITSYSTDKTRFIARVSGNMFTEHYYLYDTKEAAISNIGVGFQIPKKVKLGNVTKFDYVASDKLAISSYLTLPSNSKVKKYKLIVMPHGGPESRDTKHFDWMRQFFAAEGYAVFQPNFRGSDGFGKDFAEKGYKQWGKQMQTDVDDGVTQLIEKGIVDKDHICIVGASYGGYVAMYAATTNAKRYKCAVSFAGISELQNVFYHTEEQKGGLSYWKKSIGEDSDAEALKAYSPLDIATENTAPLLLLHGEKDTVVPAFQSEKMYKRLKELKVATGYYEIDDGDHWLSKGVTRKQFLKHSLEFINKHI